MNAPQPMYAYEQAYRPPQSPPVSYPPPSMPTTPQPPIHAPSGAPMYPTITSSRPSSSINNNNMVGAHDRGQAQVQPGYRTQTQVHNYYGPPNESQQPLLAPGGGQNLAQFGELYRSSLYAQCAAGVHDSRTKYGIGGILAAILCFPCGLICLFADTEERCNRCGVGL